MNKRIILFILFFSTICIANTKSILAEEGADEDDSTSPVDDSKTNTPVTNTPSVTVPDVTTPKVTTIEPTTEVPTTPPTAPPINDPPTVPAKPDEIIDVETEAPTNAPSEDVADKVVIKTPPITITKETTEEFVNSIKKDDSSTSPPPPTIPPVEKDSKKLLTPTTQLDKLENGKIYGVSIDEMKGNEPTLSSTSYGEEDKKTQIYVESKNENSVKIINNIEKSVVQNLEIHLSFNKKSEKQKAPGRMLDDDYIPELTGCGIFGNVVDSLFNNIHIVIDQNIIINCDDGMGGLLFNKVVNCTISNVRIEFYNDKSPVYYFIYPGQAFGLLAAEVSSSHIFMTRVTGDYFYVWPNTDAWSDLIASPLIGRSESTLIESCYVDLKEVTLNFNDMDSKTKSVVIGGLIGEYIVSETSTITRPEPEPKPEPELDRMIVEDDSKAPIFNKTNNQIYKSFVVIRSGFSVPKITDGNKKTGKIDYGGLIGKLTINKDNKNSSIFFINNCYYSMVANGIVNPLSDGNGFRFGGLIAEKNDEGITARRRRRVAEGEAGGDGGDGDVKDKKTFKLQLNMSYVNYNVKSNYMDIENFGIFYGGEKQFDDDYSLLLNNYGYVSLPFASNDSNILNYHYLDLSSSNSSVIGKRMRLLEEPTKFVDVVTYGYGVDEKSQGHEENSEKAEEILTNTAGYKINPYTKKVMNSCPSPTNAGFYETEYSGFDLSPETRGSVSKYIKYKKLKSTNKMNSKMTCPNNCNRNGACYYGKCYCNNYYTGVDCSEHFCPFGVPLISLNNNNNDNNNNLEIPSLECSNQGKCDKTTGKCNCFPGYEGIACQRTKCPNQCSNHGICTTLSEVNRIDIGSSDENDEYVIDYEKKLNNYRDNIINVCVCDKEYYGDDCSKRKCPYGYTQDSDCEANNVDGIKFTFSKDLDDSKAEEADQIYIKYIDPFKRIWYSKSFDYSDEDEWKQALGTLPTGVISISGVDKIYTDPTKTDGEFTIDISYSIWQTGKQPAIEVIGKNELANMGVPTDGSYYGLKDNGDLLDIVKDSTSPSTDQVTLKVEVGESLKATPCSNNGICNEATGICKCFEMFYGNACELQSEVI